MNVRDVAIPAASITDINSFHRVFKDSFKFPEHYGHNMNAWIDCMTDVAEEGELVVMRVEGAEEFAGRLPEVWLEWVACTAAVNQRFAGREGLALAIVPV